jgi:ubiquinone/menaquinone biosynthesis C-methylase UbiE
MGFYDRVVVPRMLAFAMRQAPLVPYREKVAGAARGRVLEIGIGSGLNLPFYGSEVSAVIGVDPSPALLAMADKRRSDARFPVELIEGSSEALPLEDKSVDTVVTTWTLCSIADAAKALAEARRVLKPGGELLFVEHGRAPEAAITRWQDRITPVWKHLTGGCHLNRPIDSLVRNAGFELRSLETGYFPGPKIMTFLYQGRAGIGG